MSLVSRVVGAGILALACAGFYLERDREESSNIVAVMAAQARVVAPLTAAAQAPQRGNTPAAPRATPPPAPRDSGARPQGPASAADSAKTEARLKNPLLTWTTTSNKEVEARTYVRLPSDRVRTSADCGFNGLSVRFSLQSLVSDPLKFDWYEDRDSDEPIVPLIADVRVIPDNVAPHVARGHAAKKNDTTYYVNDLGLLFYDAATRQRAERGALTGVRELDSVLGALFQQTNQRIVESWLRTTAGSLASLLTAQSIRVELPIEGLENNLELDLNPQDKVLHALAADCNARLTGGAPPQPAPRQIPPQTAPRGGAQR